MPNSSLKKIYEQVESEIQGGFTAYVSEKIYNRHLEVFEGFFDDIVNKIVTKLTSENDKFYILNQWDNAKRRNHFNVNNHGIQWRHKNLKDTDKDENHHFHLIDYLRIRKKNNVELKNKWDGTSIFLRLNKVKENIEVEIGIIQGSPGLTNIVTNLQNVIFLGTIRKIEDEYIFHKKSNDNEINYEEMLELISEKFVEQFKLEKIIKKEDSFEESRKNNKIFVLKNEVDSIINSIKTKPFIILSGISGTGKTQLARAIAENFVRNGNNFTVDEEFEIDEKGNYYNISIIDKTNYPHRIVFTPVRPDWTDNRKIWGYLNPLEKRDNKKIFYASDILLLVLRAHKDLKNEYFLILDEMNLARVEYYFSDILSLMESPGETVELHSYKEEETIDPETGENIPPKISWPSNINIIGTVNVDETTFSFAPKVLDRAFVLEFLDVDYGLLLNDKEDKELLDFCNDLGNILSSVNKHFGYRTVKEMKEYISNAGGGLEHNKDFLLKSKVLPKLHGTASDLEEVLLKLGNYCLINRDSQLHQENVFPNRELDKRFPESYKKLKQMYNRLVSTGFTSFF